MNMIDIIAKRRDGTAHTREEIQFLVAGATNKTIPDYQLSAWLMAAVLNPLSAEETAWLTLEMAASGDRLDLTRLNKPWVDKHSTGGVGDKTTLVALPLMAACGLTAVKMSGRGLGITGGTIDKLESIPGFRTDLSPDQLIDQAIAHGIALTGQTPKLAPADKALYALRDATATVASIPLITSSILSKKIAGGAETLVLDVKAGCGGFMPTLEAAKELAASLKSVAELAGLKTLVAITDMNQPLGRACGNALEIVEAVETLKHDHHCRFAWLCKRLVGMLLWATGKADSVESGHAMARDALESGRAKEKAMEWMEAQGADAAALFADPDGHLPRAKVVRKVFAHQAGWLERMDAATIGRAVVELGGGRSTKDDPIDHAVGIVCEVEVGDRIEDQQLLAVVHARSDEDAEMAIAAVSRAVTVSSSPVDHVPVLLQVI